jgi:ADP-ribose pyrophosphatase YjhB (NUDIX family)
MGQQVQRVAAYAVIVRDDQVLLCKLSKKVTKNELWTLPGGGVEHGEDPREAVVREVAEETGFTATVGENAQVFSAHMPDTWRRGRRVDAHSLRIVYEGWVPVDVPEPAVQEVDGSTERSAWCPIADVLDGTIPTVSVVTEALRSHQHHLYQRIGAYTWVERDGHVLMTRISPKGVGVGHWTLPGGGVDHGEDPRDAAARELHEETGLTGTIGELLTVDSLHLTGTGPNGRTEDFHGVYVIYRAEVPDGVEPRVVEVDGTTDAVEWVPIEELGTEGRPVFSLVKAAVEAAARG